MSLSRLTNYPTSNSAWCRAAGETAGAPFPLSIQERGNAKKVEDIVWDHKQFFDFSLIPEVPETSMKFFHALRGGKGGDRFEAKLPGAIRL